MGCGRWRVSVSPGTGPSLLGHQGAADAWGDRSQQEPLLQETKRLQTNSLLTFLSSSFFEWVLEIRYVFCPPSSPHLCPGKQYPTPNSGLQEEVLPNRCLISGRGTLSRSPAQEGVLADELGLDSLTSRKGSFSEAETRACNQSAQTPRPDLSL